MDDDRSTPARLADIELTSAKIFNDFQDYPEALSLVAAIFRDNYCYDVRSLQSALTIGDSARIAFLAHKMRGSILCFHQDGAALIAGALEEKARRNDLEGIDRLIESLAHVYDLVCSSLERAERMFVEPETDLDSQTAG